MVKKKKCRICGTPIYPIRVGGSAMIQIEDNVLQTSEVLRMKKCKDSAVRFETRNTRYRLKLPVKSQ